MIRIGAPFELESLLSSSPPGFELNLDIRSDFVKADEQLEKQRQLQLATKARWCALGRIEDEPNANTVKGPDSESEQRLQGASTCWSNEDTSRRIASWESYYDCDDSVLDCAGDEPAPGRLSRKVSFADRLESVLVIDESPDDPPWSLCGGGGDDDGLSDAAVVVAPAPVDEPRLAPSFAQPAADYAAFRGALETRLVSLVNVVVRGWRVAGTVRVKNVAYDKSVVVRHSFDDWATHDDAPATYQPDDDERFDTFAFAIDCPPNRPPGSKLQFAVRFSAAGVYYWDSNRGDNYEVLYVCDNSAENYRRLQHPVVFSGQPNYVWSEYSGWSDIDDASPYW